MPFCYDMIRILMVCSLLFLWRVCLFAYNDEELVDKVIMKIDDEKVYLSEFDLLYSNIGKYNDCSKDEYFHYFSRYKLKAFDAKRLGLDKKLDKTVKDAVRKEIESTSSISENSTDASLIYLLTYRVPQNEDTDCGLEFMNEVYLKLKSGIKVDDICYAISDERFLCEEIHNKDYILDEVESELYKCSKEGFSRPFKSPEGIHILINSNSDISRCNFENCVDDILLALQWDKYYSENLKKYSDGDLKDFFEENKKKYRWEFPHFKGAVIHCKNKKAAKRIRKKIKRQPIENWKGIIERMMNDNPDYDALVDVGLFQIGENAYIDKLVFKCGEYKTLEDYPYIFTVGKSLDYMPENYKDVYDVIIQDYYIEHEDAYFEDLERNFKVEKYIDVLKTVNSDGSN